MNKELEEIRNNLKDGTFYIKANQEFLAAIENILKNIGKKGCVHIGDIVAINHYGFRKSSKEEIDKIPKEDIVDYNIGTGNEYILVKNRSLNDR